MYIEFDGNKIEEFKEMHIDTSTISNEAYLLLTLPTAEAGGFSLR